VLDLMAATGARRHHDVPERLAPDYLNERFRNFHRQFIFRFQHSERACHAAAGRVEHRHLPLRQPGGQLVQVIRIGEGFGVAMHMNHHARGKVVKYQRIGFPAQQVFNKLLKQKTTGGHTIHIR
jgi:hypothetical protein